MNLHTHYYLYAKGWYLKTDVLDDLRKIQSNYTGLDEKHITDGDIIGMLQQLVFQHISNEWSFLDFLEVLDPQYNWKHREEPSLYQIRLIEACLHTLRFIKAIGLDLGQPDFSILPSYRQTTRR